MKTLSRLLFLCVGLLFFSCTNEEERLTPNILNDDSIVTRVLTEQLSPSFNWEDTSTISLFGVSGNVILPWYSGATANIPFFILNDYKAEDGWKMVYNTCTDINNPQDDKYYLIFYNIFSGKMRTFVYNKNDVTSGDLTFWQLSFSNSTSLLNDLEPYTLPGDTLTNIREIFVSNLSSTPTKSLTRGWNAFEADFMVYDPSIADKSIAMSISAYDIKHESLEVIGDVDLSSKGTMVTTTNITSVSTPGFLNSAVSLLGDKAEDKFKKWFPDKTTDNKQRIVSTLIASSVKGIVKAGGNFLVKKFFGRESTQTLVSNSDIKISTDGKIDNKGTITSQQQSNISPISMLPLPGSKPLNNAFLLPSYNEPMGVWYLETSPNLEIDCRQYFYKVGELGFGMLVVGYMLGNMSVRLAEKQPNVVINPAILPLLEKYTVSYQLQSTQNASGPPPNYIVKELLPGRFSQNGIPFSNVVTYCPVEYGKYFFSSEDRLLILFPTYSGFRITFPISSQQMLLNSSVCEQLEGKQIGVGSNEYFKINNIEVKVTVTLYPKSPFNTNPIISTRTFKPW